MVSIMEALVSMAWSTQVKIIRSITGLKGGWKLGRKGKSRLHNSFLSHISRGSDASFKTALSATYASILSWEILTGSWVMSHPLRFAFQNRYSSSFLDTELFYHFLFAFISLNINSLLLFVYLILVCGHALLD